MPALPNAAQVILVTLKGTNQGAPWNVTLHTKYQGVKPTPAQLIAYITQFQTGFATHMAPIMNPLVILTTISGADLTDETGAVGDFNLTVPGTRTGTPLPTSAAVVSSWKVALRYRGGHARSYWPGGNVADVSNGRTWQSTFQTAAQTAAVGFRTYINGLTLNASPTSMVMLSYYKGKALRPTPLAVTIDSVVTHGRVDTQRRRLGKETP